MDRTIVGDTSVLPNGSANPLVQNCRLRVYIQEGSGPFSGRLYVRVMQVHDFLYARGPETIGTAAVGLSAQQCRDLIPLLELAADSIEAEESK